MANTLVKIIEAVSCPIETVKKDVADFSKANSKLNRDELAKKWCKHAVTKYRRFGEVSALPGSIPGLGTAAQIAIEGGMITGDTALLIRWSYHMCAGVALIYDRDMDTKNFADFLIILAKWCGVVKTAQPVVNKAFTKVAVAKFNKHISGKMLTKLNQKLSTTIFTKYGTKRGVLPLGKMVPFGVGVVVAGAFNHFTMKAISKSALEYFASDNGEYEMVE